MTAVSILTAKGARPGCQREHEGHCQAMESNRPWFEPGPATYELNSLEQVISP